RCLICSGARVGERCAPVLFWRHPLSSTRSNARTDSVRWRCSASAPESAAGMKSDVQPAIARPRTRLRELVADLRRLEAKLRRGGGPERIERQHQQGKLTARERLDLLL